MHEGSLLPLRASREAEKPPTLPTSAKPWSPWELPYAGPVSLGGTPLAEEIRDVLLAPRDEPVSAWSELLLMFAARAQHVAQKILPALESGTWVVGERFTDATYAYQGGGRMLDRERIEKLEDLVLQGFQPDATFYLDLPWHVSVERMSARGVAPDRFEREGQQFFERVRHVYLLRAQATPRIVVIDASQSLKNVRADLGVALLDFARSAGRTPDAGSPSP